MKREKKILRFLMVVEVFVMQGLPAAAASPGIQPASVDKVNAVIAAAIAMLSGAAVYIIRHSSK